MWQQKFGRALRRFIAEEQNATPATDRELYEMMEAVDNRRGIWPVISDFLGVIPQEAHDFYHNNWTKQFYEDVKPHKAQILELVTTLRPAFPVNKELVQAVIV